MKGIGYRERGHDGKMSREPRMMKEVRNEESAVVGGGTEKMSAVKRKMIATKKRCYKS